MFLRTFLRLLLPEWRQRMPDFQAFSEKSVLQRSCEKNMIPNETFPKPLPAKLHKVSEEHHVNLILTSKQKYVKLHKNLFILNY
jgi:hypothetical protein